MTSHAGFTREATFNVGQRVRIKLRKGVKQREVQCDTGLITNVRTRFARSPELRQIMYTVRFDRGYLKTECVMLQQIHELSLSAEDLILEDKP